MYNQGRIWATLAVPMQESPRAHDDSLPRACHAMTAYSSPCCLPCVNLRSQRWLRITPGNLTVLALTSVHAQTWQSVQTAMTGVSFTLAHRGSCESPSAEFCGRALYISCRPWADATLPDASGKASALLQTRQKLWNHSATLMVSPFCSTPST